ncbi:MAG TPA: hypothetical protein VFB58_04495 [Chloroflexota bacterium]|nr:hypothetical protein [Chloroflexota bacterium]
MAEEYENFAAREAEARRAVERWEAEGGSQEAEQPAEPKPDDTPGAEQTGSQEEFGGGRHHRRDSREE